MALKKKKNQAAKAARKPSRKPAAKRLLKKKVAPIPKGYHTLTPHLVVRGAAQAIEFYKKAFGAKQRGGVMAGPGGLVMHAELQVGDSIVMLADEFPELGSRSPQSIGGSASSLLIYTQDADALFNRAVAAGAQVLMPLANQFWGDRYGKLVDPFGHGWDVATHVEDVTPREMAKRMAAMSSQPAQG
jgi:PhnB protein